VRIRTDHGAEVVAVQIAGPVGAGASCATLSGRQSCRSATTYGLIRSGPGSTPICHRGAEPVVKVGQRAVAGETVLANLAMINKTRNRPSVQPARFLPSAIDGAVHLRGLTSIKFALEHQAHSAMALISRRRHPGRDWTAGWPACWDAQSAMGAEIDSLADAVNFGVTPAIVVYATLAADVAGRLDRGACCMRCAWCLRLARFKRPAGRRNPSPPTHTNTSFGMARARGRDLE